MGPVDAGIAEGPRRVPREHIVLRSFSFAARACGRAGGGGWVFRGMGWGVKNMALPRAVLSSPFRVRL